MSSDDKRNSVAPIQINWKKLPVRWVLAIAALLGVSGTGGTLFVTADQVDDKIGKRTGRIESQISEHSEIDKDRHVKIDKTFKKIDKTINSIQDVQHSQVARQEARRVTESIKNRTDREKAYDRLLSTNRRRLKRGKEPCANVDCTN